jgi:Skp family chaperone for outer membrane proteins
LAEYEKAKANLETLFKTWETKLSKCTSSELPGLSKDAVAIKEALMIVTRKSADRLTHAKGKMLNEEELALRQIVADYRKRYAIVEEDLEFKHARVFLPTDVSCWLTETELQLQ